jgi:subtilase family serine protease
MQSYSDREVSRFGVWLTGGYETCPKQDQKGSWSFLGVIRYLRNYNESYTDVNDLILAADNSYVDIGARIIYTHQEKISVSAELLNRKNTSEAEMQVDETTRYTFNLNYQLPDNKLITFTYGKDFSGAVNKSGNLIAALGLIVGIGSKRPMQ